MAFINSKFKFLCTVKLQNNSDAIYRQKNSTDSDCQVKRLPVRVNAGLLQKNKGWIWTVSMTHLMGMKQW